MSLFDFGQNVFERFVFNWLFKPLAQAAFLVDKERLPTEIFKALAGIIGISGFLFGRPSFEFFTPNVTLTLPSELRSTYDFVVVGGGITGCLIAKRLSEAGHMTLLIHGPGSLPNDLTRVPLLNLGNQGNPDHDFMYSGPKLNSRWRNSTLRYNSGKDLGGSQVLSAQMWSYGKTGDYVCWEKLGISEKFSQANIRKYGKLHEEASAELKGTDYPYGNSGEVKLSYSPIWSPYYKKFGEVFEKIAAQVTGTQVNADQNSDALGFGRIIHAVEPESGYISTPVRAFLENDVPDTLHIVTRHMVRKVIFDTNESPPRAIGVEFVQPDDRSGARKMFVNATKRVILTAGAIRTPQLLTLSGVGSEADLRKWKIEPVVIRKGVGQNLHDHYDIGNAAVCFPEGTKGYQDVSVREALAFAIQRQGQFRTPLGVQSYGFFRSQQSNLTTCPDPEDTQNCRPDFELIFHNLGQNTQAAAKHYYSAGITDEHLQHDFYLQGRDRNVSRSYIDTNFNQAECLMMTPTLLHPQYRGQVTLTSDNPLDNPILDLKTTSDPRDMRLFGELWQTVKKIMNESFKGIGGKFDDTPYPECGSIANKDSYEFGTCQAERYMKSAWHMAGSCRLGRESDPMAVVNENFHVIGVQNLVVADASILPCPTSGHMLPTISALAEMAAQELKENFK